MCARVRSAQNCDNMTAEEIIGRVKELPVVSQTARKLTSQLNQPEVHRDSLVETLRCDNVLTAKLLRTCNSAASGLTEPVVSVDQAVLLLGFDMIFRIVCAISFAGTLGTTGPGYDTEANGLWAHSLQTATAAEYLAGSGCYGDFLPATAFTAGLLHDIGKTIIAKVLTPKNRADIRSLITAESLSRVDAEKAVLGADHAEIGAALLKRWGVPEPLIEATGNHHSPVIKPRPRLSALVYLANCGAHLSASAADATNASPGWQAEADQIKQAAANKVQLPIEQVDQMMAGINDAMEAMSNLMAMA